MDRIWIITKRELATFFDSLTAYVMIVVFFRIERILYLVKCEQYFCYRTGKAGRIFSVFHSGRSFSLFQQ